MRLFGVLRVRKMNRAPHDETERRPMTRYEIVFENDSPTLMPGSTLDIAGAQWEIERVDPPDSEQPPRLHLVHRDAAGDGKVKTNIRLGQSPKPPTSFESELVYTLNDLSQRLSSLASVLNAYWDNGAA
jgi:hypothetical protein